MVGQEAASPEAVAEQVLTWCDDTVAGAMLRFPPSRTIGCAPGCAWCCHLKVLATPVEVLAVAGYLRRTLAPDALARFQDRVERTDAVTRGMGTSDRAALKLPCPVLQEGACAAYSRRPVHCAGANAFDPDACRAAFERPDEDALVEHYPAQRLTADATMAGLSRALFGARLDGRPLELVAGLAVALRDARAEERWRSGEPVFAEAVDRELEALLGAG